MKITSKFRMTARLSGTDLALKHLLCSKVPVISRLLKYKLCPPPFVSRVLLSWQLVDPYRYESSSRPARGSDQTVYKKNININVTCCVVPFKIGIRLWLKIVGDTT